MAGAHGLILAALARAGAQLNEPRYLTAAAHTFDVVSKQLIVSADGDVRRLFGSNTPGSPADYAALAIGCREFAKATKRAEAETLADRLLARAGSVFFDPAQGTYLASPATLPVGIFVRAPAAVVPCGALTTEDDETLPIALQFAMPRCADLRLMSVVTAAEAALRREEP